MRVTDKIDDWFDWMSRNTFMLGFVCGILFCLAVVVPVILT